MKYRSGVMLVWLVAARPLAGDEETLTPYARQVAEQGATLHAESAQRRAGAAEALGFVRAYGARDALIVRLGDRAPLVRREAAMALAWCGDRNAIEPLLEALGDEDWVTRQAAHVSLTNLTGMEFPFDSMAAPQRRARQAKVWRNWWAAVPPDRPPADVLALLGGPRPWASVRSVNSASGKITDASVARRFERGFRALGALAGKGGTAAVLENLGPADDPRWPVFETYRMSSWLPAVCTDRKDLHV